MNKLIFSFLILWCFSGCKEESQYQGFSVSESGLNYKFHSLGDKEDLLQEDDIITFVTSKYDGNGAVIQEEELHYLKTFNSIEDSGLKELLGKMSIGDSASFVHVIPGGNQLVSCKLVMRNAKQVANLLNQHPEYLALISEPELLGVFSSLNTFQSDSIQYVGGMFLIHQIFGSGTFPDTGDEVVFHMESRNVKGYLFESTKRTNTPFSYVLGDQDQVIEGLDYGVRRMKKGGEATLIIPSPLAYGEKGSSTGLILPFTTLVYSIEMIEVNPSVNPN